ncbi:MAG: HEAT repeat domain-containing protein, partial [Candidatus Omnitrophota bacterium]
NCPDPSIRIAAVNALDDLSENWKNWLGMPDELRDPIIEALLKSLSDIEGDVREIAWKVLRKLNAPDEDLVRALVGVLNGPHSIKELESRQKQELQEAEGKKSELEQSTKDMGERHAREISEVEEAMRGVEREKERLTSTLQSEDVKRAERLKLEEEIRRIREEYEAKIRHEERTKHRLSEKTRMLQREHLLTLPERIAAAGEREEIDRLKKEKSPETAEIEGEIAAIDSKVRELKESMERELESAREQFKPGSELRQELTRLEARKGELSSSLEEMKERHARELEETKTRKADPGAEIERLKQEQDREMRDAREKDALLRAKGNNWEQAMADARKDAVVWVSSVENNESAIEPLLERLSDPDKLVRRRAAEAICNLALKIKEPEKKVQAVEKLESVLFHDTFRRDAEFREIVTAALGNIRHEKAIHPLVIILADGNLKVRINSVDALRQIGKVLMRNPEEKKDELGYIIYALTDALKDRNRKVRRFAAMALREMGTSLIMPYYLASSFDTEKIENILSGCIFAAERKWEDLQWLREDAIPGLVGELNDEEVSFRENAARRLGDMASGEIDLALRSMAVEELVKHLSDKDVGVVSSSMYALGRIGDLKAVERLKNIFGNSKVPPFIRAKSIEALANIGSLQKKGSKERKDITKFVLDALSVRDASIRVVVVNMLGKLGAGDDRVPPAVAGCFYHQNLLVVKASISALTRLGIEDEGVVKLLVPELESGSRNAKLSAIVVLDNLAKKGKVKDGPAKREAMEILFGHLSDRDDFLRKSARLALAHLGATAEQFVRANVRALDSEHPSARGTAAYTLKTLRGIEGLDPHVKKDAVRAMFKTLANDPDENIRMMAWDSLGSFGAINDRTRKQSARAYINAIYNPNPEIRLLAVKALRHWGSTLRHPSMIAYALMEVLDDEVEEIRREAAEGLNERASNIEDPELETILYANLLSGGIDQIVQSGKRYMQFLREAMESGPEVRRAAVQALGQIAQSLEEESIDIESLVIKALVDISEDIPEDSEAKSLIVSTLNDALSDDDYMVRENAIIELNKIASPESAPALISALEGEEYIRYTAVTTLGAIGDSRAVQALINVAKNDDNPHTRKEAVNALASIDGREAASYLIEILEEGTETDEELRQAAVNGLAKMKDTKAWMYSSLLKNEDAWIKHLITGKQIIFNLIADLRDSSPSARVDLMKPLNERVIGFAEDILLSGETNPAAIKCWRILNDWVIYTLNRICDKGMKAPEDPDEEKATLEITKIAEDIRDLVQPKDESEIEAEGLDEEELQKRLNEEELKERVRQMAEGTLGELTAILSENTEAKTAIIRASAENPQEIGEREEQELLYEFLHSNWASQAANALVHQILISLQKISKMKGSLFGFRRYMIFELADALKSDHELQNEMIAQRFEMIDGDDVARFYRDLYRKETAWVVEKTEPRDAALMRGLLINALDYCPNIRKHAAIALGKIAPLLKVDESKIRQAFLKLAEIFENDTKNDVRVEAVRTLGEIILNLETAPKIREALDEEIKELSSVFITVLKNREQDGEV